MADDDHVGNVGMVKQPGLKEVKFPYLPVAITCLGMLAHAISFTSPFPFVAYMIVDFKMAPNLDEAGFAAGWIAGMFMIGRALSGIPWGIAADRFGRKICLFVSTFNVMVFGIIFGFSTNFYMAVAARFCLGIGNGLLGIAKTYLSEVVSSKEHEMLAISYMNGVYTLGLIVGPSLGGLLARPAVQYPTVFASTGFFGRFPYLLPSLIGAAFALSANLGVLFFLPETLKRDQQKGASGKGEYAVVNQLVPLEEEQEDDGNDIEMMKLTSSNDENRTGQEEEEEEEDRVELDNISEFKEYNDNLLIATTSSSSTSPATKVLPSTFKEILLDPSIQNMFIVYMSFCFICVLSDEIFPLYAVTSLNNGGLAWQMVQVGEALAAIGVALIIFQFFILPPCMKRYFINGQKDVLIKGTIFVAFTMPLLPLLSDWTIRIILSDNPEADTKRNYFLFVIVVISIALFKMTATVAFTSITVVINSLVDSSKRGTLNGIMMTAGTFSELMSFIFSFNIFIRFRKLRIWIQSDSRLCSICIRYSDRLRK
jgi:MFS family permease